MITNMKKRTSPPHTALRMTRQRQVIIEELRKVKSHPTADQIYERVRRRLRGISLGTVYRNLDLLSERGVILKLDLAGSQRRYDGNTDSHYHVRCMGCGRVDDAGVEPVAELDKASRKVSGYRIIGHKLEFIGICPGCQRRRQGARR